MCKFLFYKPFVSIMRVGVVNFIFHCPSPLKLLHGFFSVIKKKKPSKMPQKRRWEERIQRLKRELGITD